MAKQQKLRVAFDCDGCLLHSIDTALRELTKVGEQSPDKDDIIALVDMPRQNVVDTLVAFLDDDRFDVIVWSGAGLGNCERVVGRLGIGGEVTIAMKSNQLDVDICFDDQDVKLAKVNIKI